MSRVYLSTGSNQGDRLKALLSAFHLIELHIGNVIDFSDVVETEPWGFEADLNFFNQVLIIETEIQPLRMLEIILEIEGKLGRTREGAGYKSRNIDIDILFYDQQTVIFDQLKIPHPLMHLRRFVLQPLEAIAPDFVHPVLQKPIKTLLSEIQDASTISTVINKSWFGKMLKSIQNGNSL